MAINKKLIHFNEKTEFEKRLANNEILDTSIVFVKDSKEIWTHGNYYAGESIDPELLEQIQTSVQELKANIDDNPFEKGDAENSAVLKGGNNQVISESSVALGKDNIVGLKGWYYSSIYKENDNTISVYLSNEQKAFSSDEDFKTESQTADESLPNLVETLGVNAVISLVNAGKYDNKFIVIGGSNGVVRLQTIDESVLPFDIITGQSVIHYEDYSIYCLSKPDAGIADLGKYSFAVGYNNKATNGESTAFGYNNHAYGKFSFVEGKDNKAGYASHAEGRSNIASGSISHAEGRNNVASGYLSHAEGGYNIAEGAESHAEGYYTIARGAHSHAEGTETIAKGDNSHAEGSLTKAEGTNSHAEGQETSAEGKWSHAEGFKSQSKGDYSHAEGQETLATNEHSHAEGYKSQAIGAYSHAEGYTTKAEGTCSHAEGSSTTAQGSCSHAEGYKSQAIGTYSHAEGGDTKAEGTCSHAEGSSTTAQGSCSHAEGSSTKATGQWSHAEGYTTKAEGTCSHAEGSSTTAQGSYSHAEGYKTTAKGDYSHAEGYSDNIAATIEESDTKDGFAGLINKWINKKFSLAYGRSAHIEGRNNLALGDYSHAEGYYTTAVGDRSHAEGNDTKAEGINSHAEGYKTQALGPHSHAEGNETKAEGSCAHAEGYKTQALGKYSHAEGNNTISKNEAEHACGKYNLSNSDTRFSIGIGTSDTNRKNAFEVKQNGDIYIEGVEGRIQDKLDKLVEITYSELKSLRDDSKLIPGQQYRITDYITTTTQENTQSAGHPFDIIVTADDEKTLNEAARACRSEFDIEKYKDAYSPTWSEKMTYIGLYQYEGKEYHLYESASQDMQMLVDFKTITFDVDGTSNNDQKEVYPFAFKPTFAKSDEDWDTGENFGEVIAFKNYPEYFSNKAKLAAWQIWYCLDNDTERFAWADAENGKGVIYRMIDEWGNDCPYDFKNIQFKRFAVTAYDKVPSLVVDNEENHYGYYYGALRLSGSQVIHEATYGEDFVWVHTFALKDLATETWHDYTILNSIGLKTDESVIITCHSNVIKEYRDEYLGEHGRKAIWLNNIVFFNCYADISSPDYADYYSYCYSNSFGNNCHSNSFGDNCFLNTFGISCGYNSFGSICDSNSFGDYCNSNTFGAECNNNSFDNECNDNSFGTGCNYNIFGNNCYSNSFSNNCGGNSFGNNCYSNSFNSNCEYNSFGDGCNGNTFGAECSANSFGNSCNGNSFGAYCSYNSFVNYFYDNSFVDECRYNSFGNNCYQNSFSTGCDNNSFGNYCHNNSLGYDCSDNSFGNGCYENVLEQECYNNDFGNDCCNNSLVYDCYDNSFGSGCEHNNFGNTCNYNSFGNKCRNNSFGNKCKHNSFGNSCLYNSFGDSCMSNRFDDSCESNSFGSTCYSNSFGNGCSYNSFRTSALAGTLKSYCYYNHFDDGCSYNVIWYSNTTSSSKLLKNINVNRGVSGRSSKYNFINIDTINSEKEINVINYTGHIYIDYGDIFRVTYSELVDLRENSQLIPGRQYRIIDYNTTTSQENTTSAGHPFDIIVTAIDNESLSEEAQAAQNHINDNGYFNDSNLSAWKIWYSFDNDTDRFEWADDERIETTTVETIVADSSECTIKSELIDGNTFITPFNFESCVWVDANGDGETYDGGSNHDAAELIYEWGYFTDENDNTQLCLYKSNADLYVEEGQPDYGDKYLYRGVVNVDGTDYDYWQKWDENGDGLDVQGSGDYVFATTPRIVSNPEAYSSETITETIETVIPLEPKGVIYRMIDEFGNDLPYDFKNIMFVRYKLEAPEEYIAEGNDTLWMQQLCNNVRAMFDAGLRSFVWAGTTYDDKYWENDKRQILSYTTGEKLAFFTFNTDEGTDASLSEDTHDNKMQLSQRLLNNVFFSDDCYSNSFGYYCKNNSFGAGCDSNIFGDDCENNTFGLSCYNNTFGSSCDYNSFYTECGYNDFGNHCYNNNFGNDCRHNSFGNNCNYNIFGDDCVNNTFGNDCDNNTFGNECYSNSFGNECYKNSFGNNCIKNSFGKGCHDNNFGGNCSYNSFDNICSYNSFGKYCRYNSFGNSCSYNSFVEGCDSNSFGNQCDHNTFGKNCRSNSFGNECCYNSFGNGYSDNSFGNTCHHNSFGNECYKNSFGDYCIYNIFGDRCTNNSFGNSCFNNSFRTSASQTSSLKAYCEYNHFDDGCSYNVIWNSDTTSSSKLLKNINVNRGVSGKSSNYNFINIDTLNADYEIQVAKNSKGEIKIYCEADLIA